MNRRLILLGVAALGAAGLAIFGDRTPSGTATVEAAPRAARTAEPAAQPARRAAKHAAEILALQPRATLIGHDVPTHPPSLFGSDMFAKAPPAEDRSAAAEPPAGPPPLPFTYLGKKYENATWEVFLAIGDNTYFVREGSVIDQAYVVNSIRPPILTLTFLPMKQIQTMTIGGDE